MERVSAVLRRVGQKDLPRVRRARPVDETGTLLTVQDSGKLEQGDHHDPEKGSVQVFPPRNKEGLYGAVQTGQHRFYQKEKGREEHFASAATFTHLWRLQNGKWRFSRVLSYNHQTKDNSASAETSDEQKKNASDGGTK